MASNRDSLKPSIFVYDSYRTFLKDLYNYLKSEKPFFSYRYFSKKAGFKSTNILKLVIDGDRNLSPKSITQFGKGLSLAASELKYFEALVYFNQSLKPDQKTLFAQKLLQLKSEQSLHPLEKAELNYYRHWYYLPLRELIASSHFKEDPEWISNQLTWSVDVKEIQIALTDLETLGLVYRDSKNKLKLTHKTVTTRDEIQSSLVANYHREMLQKASESIEKIERKDRDISALCVPVSQATAHEIKRRIQQFRQDLLALAEGDVETERVYQLNIQLFPLTKGSPT